MKVLKSMVLVVVTLSMASACKNLEKVEDAFPVAVDQEIISEVSSALNLTVATEASEAFEVEVEADLTEEIIEEEKNALSLRKIIREIKGNIAEGIAECAGVVSSRTHRLEIKAQVDALGEDPSDEAKAALATELKVQREAFRQTIQDNKESIEACYAAQEDSDMFDLLSDIREYCPIKKGKLKNRRAAKKRGEDHVSKSGSSAKKFGRKNKIKTKHVKNIRKSIKKTKVVEAQGELKEMISKASRSKNFDEVSCQESLLSALTVLN